MKRIIAPVMLVAGLTMASVHADDHRKANVSFIDTEGQSVGSGTLIDGPHGVLIDLDLHGLPPGRRGIHIHAIGDCDDPDDGFMASGGHLNPEGRKHGLMHPDGPDNGDLPNLIVREDGTVQVELFTHLASLDGAPGRPAILDYDGAALVIHEHRDDHYSQPIGGAGPRIACGMIKPSE